MVQEEASKEEATKSQEEQLPPQNAEYTVEEVYVPSRHLAGLIPEGLTEEYCFWHSVDDPSIIRGYAVCCLFCIVMYVIHHCNCV